MDVMVRPARFSGRIIGFACLFTGLFRTPAHAHVKWFSQTTTNDKPLSITEVVTPTFVALAVLSIAVIVAFVFLDRRLAGSKLFQRLTQWLEARKDRSLLIMRIAVGTVLLLSWQSEAMLAPELQIASDWIGWLQFLLAFLLLFDKTVPLAGVGLFSLYLVAIAKFGTFHMLDYMLLAGVSYYLMVAGLRNDRVRGTGLPALYATVGLSLCWVALEKMIYPQWSMDILAQHPGLALGLDPAFFLLSAAFIEFSLGYLLIICLFDRPLALTITVVSFLTTTVFGKTEVIGHTIIHAALLVFLIEGPGNVYRAPIQFHKRSGLRTAFATVNFLLLLGLLLASYSYGARLQHERTAKSNSAPALAQAPLAASPVHNALGVNQPNGHVLWVTELSPILSTVELCQPINSKKS